MHTHIYLLKFNTEREYIRSIPCMRNIYKKLKIMLKKKEAILGTVL